MRTVDVVLCWRFNTCGPWAIAACPADAPGDAEPAVLVLPAAKVWNPCGAVVAEEIGHGTPLAALREIRFPLVAMGIIGGQCADPPCSCTGNATIGGTAVDDTAPPAPASGAAGAGSRQRCRRKGEPKGCGVKGTAMVAAERHESLKPMRLSAAAVTVPGLAGGAACCAAGALVTPGGAHAGGVPGHAGCPDAC